jgi:catechol 2,3-dioxygenase-like lactoylglutathione lyase family enzyme
MVKLLALALFAGVLAGSAINAAPDAKPTGDQPMRLGNFSVSLPVKDLAVSKAFYEKLGFRSVSGDNKTWSVMKNGEAKVGLFQGMFDKTMLTFNPGWDSEKNTLPEFDDVRQIQARLKALGVPLTATADEASTGPAYITLTDPDGNPILIDQHVDKPKK